MAKKSKSAAAESNVSPEDEAECFAEYADKKGQISRVQQSIAAMFGRYEKLGVDTASIKFAYSQAQKQDATGIHRARTALMMRLNIIQWDTRTARGRSSMVCLCANQAEMLCTRSSWGEREQTATTQAMPGAWSMRAPTSLAPRHMSIGVSSGRAATRIE